MNFILQFLYKFGLKRRNNIALIKNGSIYRNPGIVENFQKKVKKPKKKSDFMNKYYSWSNKLYNWFEEHILGIILTFFISVFGWNFVDAYQLEVETSKMKDSTISFIKENKINIDYDINNNMICKINLCDVTFVKDNNINKLHCEKLNNKIYCYNEIKESVKK